MMLASSESSRPPLVIAPILLRFGLPLGLPALLLISWVASPALFSLLATTLSEAYLAVSVFVALSLGGFYLLERHFKQRLQGWLRQSSPWQVPIAALLGAMPGCGGAIIVVTQYVSGSVSFGALVAVLVATMGDAAFLLLARQPEMALWVYSLSTVAGLVTGWLVNLWHPRPETCKGATSQVDEEAAAPLPEYLVNGFLLWLIPGTVLGVLAALQLEVLPYAWGPLAPADWLGLMGALLCLWIWASQPASNWTQRFQQSETKSSIGESVVAETSFVSMWVMLGFVVFEGVTWATGLQLTQLFSGLGILAVLLALLIGLLPGCGPQIMVTTLYLNGVVPFSVLMANAISNDGDALFPALALAPKAATLATLYSAIPALVVGGTLFYLGF